MMRGMGVAALLALAACGAGESTEVVEAGPNGLPWGDDALVASKSRFESLEGTTIKAAGYRADYDETGVFAATSGNAAAQITLLSNGDLRLVLDGQSYTLDRQSNGALYSSGDISVVPAFSGGSGTQSVFYFAFADDGAVANTFTRAFLFTGFETEPDDMPSGTASYAGGAGMIARDSGDTIVAVFDDPGNLLLPGDNGDNGRLALSVNFGTGVATGAITADSNALDGSAVVLSLNGTVSGNDLSGTMTQSSMNPDLVIANGTFKGTFYGEHAGDVAGAIKADVSSTALTSGATKGVGFFVGSR